MSKLITFAAILVCFVLSGQVMAQAERAEGLAAALDKTKYKKKEKKNVSVEVFAEVKNTPAVRANPAEYSGTYGSDDNDYYLSLRVAANGSAEGTGHDSFYNENKFRADFTLKDARIDGAVLRGTKIYTDGRSEPFEAVFVNRSVASGINANQITEHKTSFGLGFVQTNKSWTNRVFLEAR